MVVNVMPGIKDETFGGTYPFAPRYFDAGNFKMHYIDEGGGEPVILLHGDPTWGYLWRKFIPVLSQQHRVIVPDHMGMGKSDTPAEPYPYLLRHHIANLEALVTSLGLTGITLVVHDWGGPVGLGFAARHPDQAPHAHEYVGIRALARRSGPEARGIDPLPARGVLRPGEKRVCKQGDHGDNELPGEDNTRSHDGLPRAVSDAGVAKSASVLVAGHYGE
jgi:pimeloyl-ACP methyl ester carboxylesterase